MKITDVKTVLLTGPCTNDPFLSEARKRRSAAFIEIYTDSGIVGIGETYAGYFVPELVPEIVKFFAPILIGQDPTNIQLLWQRMYQCGNYWCRVGLGSAVLSGIEAALWDIKGKKEKLPVYQLLGGAKHKRLLCYATGGPSNYPLENLEKKIEYYLSLGFVAVKIAAGSFTKEKGLVISSDPNQAADFEAGKLEFLRRRFGKNLLVMIDGHMGNNDSCVWNLQTAYAVLEAIKEYDIFFFEEPLHYTDIYGYANLCKMTQVPVAGGECLSSFSEWQIFVNSDCFDIGQPDAAFVGGLAEFMKVSDLLKGRNRKLATHSWGAGGAFMQNIHCGFACENTIILEVAPAFGPLHSEIIDDDFYMKDGYVYPPSKPGLGIKLTDEIKNKYKFIPGSGEFNSVAGKVLRD
ncbi:MAG: mandelate racemase/muconate lactonizing enzyme family protein [Candidatus Omnitrophica bacterium]|nr:mandelate racemase/muconate lactonizing enzyme family protein [Candidatus Omnitrophota bacterium]MCM8816823.1 mandelate racemase/muconate lactonizing enzyme family protein [Candidatus Omnitrophota bacterium]